MALFKREKNQKRTEEANDSLATRENSGIKSNKGDTKSNTQKSDDHEKQSREGRKVVKTLHAATLIKPRITEKATTLSKEGTYVFNISARAGKREVSEAVQIYYKVSPKKIRIVHLPSKNKTVRGIPGSIASVKKAYVFLKKGEKIEVL